MSYFSNYSLLRYFSIAHLFFEVVKKNNVQFYLILCELAPPGGDTPHSFSAAVTLSDQQVPLQTVLPNHAEGKMRVDERTVILTLYTLCVRACVSHRGGVYIDSYGLCAVIKLTPALQKIDVIVHTSEVKGQCMQLLHFTTQNYI